MPIPPVRRLAVCSAVSLAVAFLSPPAALAQSTPPTTPAPAPEDPGQPPASVPPPVPQPGPIVAGAGTGIGLLRILPGAAEGDSILDDPEFDGKIPRQALVGTGMGLAVVQANSEAFLAQERAVAESRPSGFAVKGSAPPPPGSLAQTALPDHEAPKTGGLRPPPSPLGKLLDLGALEGSVHARWDERLGPCVQPIADATTSLADVSAVNVLPSLPSGPEGLSSLLPAGGPAPGLEATTTEALREQLGDMRGPLSRLGGLLGGQAAQGGGTGSMLSVPEAIRAHSDIRLVDVPSQDGKAVRSTSRFRLGSVRLFPGTSQELRVDVVGEPTLTATSTGSPETSTVEYEAPVLRISRGGKEIATLSATNPEVELPVGVPLPDSELDSDVPLVGHPDLPGVLDIGVLKLSIGELRKDKTANEVSAGARLLDVTLLPGESLGIPTALARISFGEQFVRAGAPAGGVHCELPAPPPQAAPEPPAPAGRPVPPLAVTGGAYHAVPLFWTGTLLLLFGATLVAALPRRR